jgi:hypothetical protein
MGASRAGHGGRVLGAIALSVMCAEAAGMCSARSAATVAPVVELYTSEGCSSCPPADRWLGALKTRPEVVALAFHVDYWDRLGWKDRFASAAFTQRQMQQQAVNGARFSYTPQVVIDGHDRKDWPRATIAGSRAPASVRIELVRDGDRVAAQVTNAGDRVQRLAAYWAVTESGHRTAVKAGENEGATLPHDFVVRTFQPVAAWKAEAGGTHRLGFVVPPAESGHPGRVNIVVLDEATGRPQQAVALECS